MRLFKVAAVIALIPMLIGASPPLRVQPSSKWVLDYAANSCRLMRSFAEGKDQITLLIESAGPGQSDMVAVGRDLYSDRDEIWGRFMPNRGKEFSGRPVKDGTQPAVLWPSINMLPDAVLDQEQKESNEQGRHLGVRPPPLDLADQARRRAERQQFAAGSTELEIATSHNHSVILETHSMGEPIKAFDSCARDSLKDWGVDPDLQDRIVRPLWSMNSGSWLSAADYPDQMIQKGQQADVTIRVLVDASGKVTNCTSLTNFVVKDFNAITCAAVTRHARFAPAELADGTKVPSYFLNRIMFRLQ